MADNAADSQIPPPLTQEQMSALVDKHKGQINAIFAIADPNEQKRAVQSLGIDTDAMEAHYKALYDRSEELRRQDTEANRKTAVTGWASLVAGGAAIFAVARKHVENTLVKWSLVILGAGGIAVAGRFAASRIFSGQIREESKQLAIQSSDALKHELAVALENKEIEAGAQGAPSNFAANIPQRDPAFAAQAVTDKNAASAVQART